MFILLRGYNNMLGSVAMRDKMIDVENATRLANDDGCVTFEEILCELKKCDFSNAEIEMFFGNSDSNWDRIIDIEESNDTLEDLDDGEDPLTGVTDDAKEADKNAVVTNPRQDNHVRPKNKLTNEPQAQTLALLDSIILIHFHNRNSLFTSWCVTFAKDWASSSSGTMRQ